MWPEIKKHAKITTSLMKRNYIKGDLKMIIWYLIMVAALVMFINILIDIFMVETDDERYSRCFNEWLMVNDLIESPETKEEFSKIYNEVF